ATTAASRSRAIVGKKRCRRAGGRALAAGDGTVAGDDMRGFPGDGCQWQGKRDPAAMTDIHAARACVSVVAPPSPEPSMRSVLHHAFGEPADVLVPGDGPLPEPGPGEVRIRMVLAPIHNHDLWTIRG